MAGFPDGATATEIAEVTGTSRPTVFRMLLSLEIAGYVERTGSNYHLGWELFRISRLSHVGPGLEPKLQPILNNCAGELNETVNFALRGPNGRFDIVVEASAPRLLTIDHTFKGQHFPSHASSSGKLLLSEMDEEEIVRVFPDTLETFTKCTIETRSHLLQELAQIRRQGYATIDGELELGLYSLSVPVYLASGYLIGAMAVYGPSERLKEIGEAELSAQLLQASEAVARVMSDSIPESMLDKY